MEWALIGTGVLAGLLVGLTGVGGGAITTPILLLGLGMPPQVAVGTDLWFAAIIKLLAAKLHHLKGAVDWQVVYRLWLGSLPASALTLAWMRQVSIDQASVAFIQGLIAVAIFITAVGLLFKEKLHVLGRYLRLQDGRHFKAVQGPLTVISGMMLGILVTLTSIGAGALGAVLLAYLYPLRLTPTRLIATDLAHAVPLALFAGIGYALSGQIDLTVLGFLLTGSLPAVVVGVRVAHFVPESWLRLFLAMVLILIMGLLLQKGAA